MKILETETVVRYLVEFDENETILLKKLGQLPEHAQPCARLRLTSEELDESRLMLADGDALLRQLYGKAESRS